MNILRWIFLLPIAILCSIIFPYLFQQLVEIFVSKNTFADTFILNGSYFFLQGIFFIVPTYFIVPKYKIQTLKVFLIIWLLVVVLGDYYLYITKRENVGIWNSILRVLGALMACLNIILEHKDETIDSKQEEKPKKPVKLSPAERLNLQLQIAKKAQNNPEFKAKVDKMIAEKKEQIDKEHNTDIE